MKLKITRQKKPTICEVCGNRAGMYIYIKDKSKTHTYHVNCYKELYKQLKESL